MELNITESGQVKSTIEVNPAIFDCAYNEDLVHQVVTSFLANLRQGTSRQKTRSEVSGGGAKPWRQKGTGRARAGTIRSPLWRSGGVTFASGRPNHQQKINKKMYRQAIRTILSELVREGRLIVVDKIEISAPKTKQVIEFLKSNDLTHVLVVNEGIDQNLYLGARNIPRVNVIDAQAINPVDLIAYEKVLMSKAALKLIEENLT